MSDFISVHDAFENNLKHIDCNLQKGKLVVITGPSGSGKSTLVFDVLHREARRRTLANHLRVRHKRFRELLPPKVEKITGLTFTVPLAVQHTRKRSGFIATHTGFYEILSTLFMSFGARVCLRCQGEVTSLNRRELLARVFEFGQGEVVTIHAVLGELRYRQALKRISELEREGYSRFRLGDEIFSASSDIPEYPQSQVVLLVVDSFRVSGSDQPRLIEAIELALRIGDGTIEARKGDTELARYSEQSVCVRCGAKQLPITAIDFAAELLSAPEGLSGFRPEVQKLKLSDVQFSSLIQSDIGVALEWAKQLAGSPLFESDATGQLLSGALVRQLSNFQSLGLDYLGLGRNLETLSAGELQKIRLIQLLEYRMQGVIYLLDEPSLGLHPRDVSRLTEVLRSIVNSGNSVIAVEHDPSVIRQADYLLELGPSGGEKGGHIVRSGEPTSVLSQLIEPEKAGAERLPQAHSKGFGNWLRVEGANRFNIHDLDVRFPLQALIAITGVSGAGKSTFASGILLPELTRLLAGASPKNKKTKAKSGSYVRAIEGWEGLRKIVDFGGEGASTNARSIVATASNIFDHIRKLFALTEEARIRGYSAGHFSFNSKAGWCPDCEGIGASRFLEDDMEDAGLLCVSCGGSRFRRDILEIRYRDLSIAELLSLTVEQAIGFFERVAKIRLVLEALRDMELGYLSLAQSTSSMSSGEMQRLRIVTGIKLAKEERDALYLFDEPSRGLSEREVIVLATVLRGLVENGATVLAIEHNVELVKHADYVIDFGPGPGERGGKVTYVGSPAEARRQSEFSMYGFL